MVNKVNDKDQVTKSPSIMTVDDAEQYISQIADQDSPLSFVKKLPEIIDIYYINEDGSIEGGCFPPDIYIDEQYTWKLSNKEFTKYIRENYGKSIGIMRHTKVEFKPQIANTDKMIIGRLSI